MWKRSVGIFLVVGGVALTAGAGVSMVRTADGTLTGDPEAVENALRNPPATIASSSPAPEQPPRRFDPAGVAAGTISTRAEPSVARSDRASVQLNSATAALETDTTPNPVSLVIGALGVSAPIDPYGVDGSGQMDVPDNVTDVGWYEFGPAPGRAGSAVLAAHVDLASQGPGVFFELDDLRQGDLVSIGYSDGSELQFRVVANTIYDKDELPLDVIFSRTGPPVLTLITCGGGFSRSERSYDSNVVVYAVPVTADIAVGPGTR